MWTRKFVFVVIGGLVFACFFTPCGSAALEDDAADDSHLAAPESESQQAEGTNDARGTPEEGGGQPQASAASSEAAANNSPPEGSEGGAEQSESGGEGGEGEEDSAPASSQASLEESEEGALANNTDMKASLADYLIDLLTEADKDNNDDDNKQQEDGGEGAPSASPDKAQSSAANEGAAVAAASSDGGPAAEEGASQSQSQAPQNSDTGNAASSTKGSSAEGEGDDEVIDCSKEVDLRDFCDITPKAFRDFFKDDVTVKGLRETFMDMQTVEDLKSCRRGEWCLGNRLKALRGLEDKMYKFPSPLCQEGMWECLFKTMLRRQSCDTDNDKEFLFVVDALDLLCSMSGVDAYDIGQDPTEREGSCIAHVHAALSVSYADFMASGLEEFPTSQEISCEGDAFRMSETYLCADESCQGQFESRKAMEEFRRWGWFLESLDQRVDSCPSLKNDSCGVLHLEVDSKPQEPYDQPSEWYDFTSTTWSTPSWFFQSTTPSYNEQPPEGGSIGTSGMFDREDESMAVALTVSTSMVLVVMLLGVFFYWRRRRANSYYYRAVTDGYDKVPSDEARLLGRSSSD